jgi:hypothetical protein
LVSSDDASSSRYTTKFAAEVPNTQVAILAPAEVDTTVAEQPVAQEDETAKIADGLTVTNLLVGTTAGIVDQVLAT